jgi:hypothetical protein
LGNLNYEGNAMAKSLKNSGKPWSSSENSKLKNLANHNKPTGLIAWELGRSVDAVRSQASRNGISLKPTNQSPYNRRKK